MSWVLFDVLLVGFELLVLEVLNVGGFVMFLGVFGLIGMVIVIL